MVLNYIQFAENYVLTGQETVQIGGFGPKFVFFSIKMHWLTAKDYSLAVSKLA